MSSASAASASSCTHHSICFECSRHHTQAGFERPDRWHRVAATKLEKKPDQGKSDWPDKDDDNPKTFPAPLVLPGDEIANDPECPPQSFQEWLDDEDRNPVTKQRRTVYVVPAPQIPDEVEFMREWISPRCHQQTPQPQLPCYQDVHEYLTAFYHGISVKFLPQSAIRFMAWETEKASKTLPRSKSRLPKYIGFGMGHECVRIRIRPSRDGVFSGQLNLNDLLDAAIRMLPKDAYALLFLVNHDIYEDEDDDFACGRAYGGSRVAVVSSARYNPSLDDLQSVERDHAWPASHCSSYVSALCDEAEEDSGRKPAKRHKPTKKKPAKASNSSSVPRPGPLEAAISVHRSSLLMTNLTLSSLSTLWLGRVCRTASHELGHCFGIEHCMYYACAMQSTASMSEDAAQPPYLCPVDLAKVLHATSDNAIRRYNALLAFCEKPVNQESPFFLSFAAWIRGRLDEMGV